MGSEMVRIIGLLSMIIDHAGAAFFPDQLWLRMLGRASFPIFAVFLVKGLEKTRSPGRYFLRLGVTAAVAQVPFRLLFESVWWNTLFAFSLWVLVQMAWKHLRMKYSLGLAWRPVFWIGAAILAQALKLEYLYYGMGFLALITEFKPKSSLWWCFWTGLHVSVLFSDVMSWIQVLAFLTPFWIPRIRWERPKSRFGYGFYPLHLAVLYWIHLKWPQL